MKRSLFTLLLFATAAFTGFSQTFPPSKVPDSLFHDHIHCGVTPEYLASLAVDQSNARTVPVSFPAYAIESCGKFAIYYEDLIVTNPQAGFSDPVTGAARRGTLCAVLTYLQSVLDFSNVPAGAPIRLHVGQSYAAVANPAPPSAQYFAFAGPNFINTGSPHVINGFVYDYATSGTDPASANQYHAEMTVNFHQTQNINGGYDPINYLNDYTQPIQNCQYDLFSILLHEIGHTCGFLSYAHSGAVLDPNSINGASQFSGLDFMLHHSSGMSSLSGMQKMILGSASAPYMNPLFTSSFSATDNAFWLNGNAAPNNHPIYSGLIFNNTPNSFAAGSVLSHMDEQVLVYTNRQRISPGAIEENVMGPYGIKGHLRRRFTDAEINVFLGLGFGMNPSYSGASTLANLPPYSTKVAGYTNYSALYNFAETVAVDFPPLVNNVANSFTIDLQADATAMDPEGAPVTVAPGTLINLQGCGNGGNNHNQLTVSPDGRYITYVARPNFFGRVQFGFKLFDGQEVGSFHFYTFEVLPGTNVNFPAGSNLILNGDLEEGTEVRRLGAEENIDNSTTQFGIFREGLFRHGVHLSDAHPYNHVSNEWFPVAGGDIVGGSQITCNGTTYKSEAGFFTNAFPNVMNPAPAGNNGQRFRNVGDQFNYFTLGAPVQPCKRYVLKFDYYTRYNISMYSASTTVPLQIGFTNAATFPASPVLTYSFTENLPAYPTGTWHHVEIPFTYCASTSATFMNLQQNLFWHGFLMDNFELVEVTTPPSPLVASISNSSPSFCAGAGSSTLTASVANPLCNVTYFWSPGGATSSSITVSPGSTTNYTVTVSDGCRTTTQSSTVTITPPPTITSTIVNYDVCEGTSLNPNDFASSPAGATFNWTNSNTSIGLPASGTGDLPTFTTQNPTSGNITATITVTPSNGACNGTPVSFTITVKPKPEMVTPPSISVCAGTIIPASAFSSVPMAGNFIWMNSNTSIGLGSNGVGNIPAFTATNTTSSPVTATITVIPVGVCSGDAVFYTITVNPASPLVVTPPSATIPYGGSVALNVTGGTSYTWTPSTGLSCTNCPNPTANPTATTTYTVTSTNANGCPVSGSVTVTIPITACTDCPYTLAPAGTLSASPTGGRVYCVNNNILVTGNVNISNCELKMASNTQITVASGATLTISGSHLYSCGAMWIGIQVMPGGKIVTGDALISLFPSVVYKSSLIEDAMTAINIASNSPITANLLSVTNTTFNRNAVAIKVNDYNDPSLTTYPFSIVKSVFTCRNIQFTPNSLAWPQTSAVAGPNTVLTQLNNQVVDNAAYQQTGTAAYLKAPYAANTKSHIGLDLNNVGHTLNASSTSPTYREFSIGRAEDVNIFDNLRIGVNLLNSNFNSVNNIYQNTGIKGIGIYAQAEATKNNRLQVVSVNTTTGANKFVDCGWSIRSLNYFEHNLQYNDVRSSQVNSNSTTVRNGFNIETNRYRVCNILRNSMYNVSNAILFNATNGNYNVTGINTFGQYAGQVNVDYNTIRPHLPNATVTTQYVLNAIVLENSGSVTQFANNVISIISTNTNTIIANRGIYYNSWRKQNVQSQNNNITVLSNPYLFVGAQYFGISVNNNIEGSALGNFVKGNTVAGFYNPTANSNPASDPNLQAIVFSLNGRFIVTCNNTSKTTWGIGFRGGNQNATFKYNGMQQHRYGYVLDMTGVIGTQGTSTNPADNRWIGTWVSGTFKTATVNLSTAQSSIMHTRTATAYNPNGSGFSDSPTPSVDAYSTTSVPQNLFNYPLTPPIQVPCYQVISFPHFIKTLEDIAQDKIIYSNPLESMRYINKYQLHQTLKSDTTLLDSSAILDFFYTQSLATPSEVMSEIEENMADDVAQAVLDNASFTPQNTIESNYKNYFTSGLNHYQEVYSDADHSSLLSIAEKCPFIDGAVVYQARALYNAINGDYMVFEDNCPLKSQARSAEVAPEMAESTFDVVLYPNPAQDEVFLSFEERENAAANVSVRDANGKLVFDSKEFDISGGLINFRLNVMDGVYFVHITDKTSNETIVKKLVIQK